MKVKKKKAVVVTRCIHCGQANKKCDHFRNGRGGFKQIEVKNIKERHKCRHKWDRVYGVPTWRRLCLKCGGMSR